MIELTAPSQVPTHFCDLRLSHYLGFTCDSMKKQVAFVLTGGPDDRDDEYFTLSHTIHSPVHEIHGPPWDCPWTVQ